MGTRLGELTRETPKPLLPVGGRPFLAYQIDWLARSGVGEIIVSTGYLPDQFAAFFAGNRWNDPHGDRIRVSEAREDVRAGTAGALALAADRLAERFLLVNGDTYFDCDLAPILGAAERLPDGHMLLTVREVEDAARYGRIQLGGEGRVTRFSEKEKPGPGLISTGIAVLDRSVLDLIDKVPCSLEHDVYPRLVEEGRLHAISADGYFIDIGLPDTYGKAQQELPRHTSRPAVFFDRDGVLNVDHGHTFRPDDLEFVEGAPEAVRLAREAGYLTVVVSNQAGVAKGYYDEVAVDAFHRHMNAELRRQGAWIDAFYYCPFHPDGVIEAYRSAHPDRKPEPGMIHRAILDLRIDKSRSLLVGDAESDMLAAEKAGIKGYRYVSGPLDALVAEALSISGI
jgi:D-glycero-D-manno-heptose 1,7-bisphosphate phosphatase